MYKRLALFVVWILPLFIFSGCGKAAFTISEIDYDHEAESSETYESYSGTGTIETESDGAYYVLVGYEKDGGDQYTEDTEFPVIVIDGEGELTTYDSAYYLDNGEELEEPEYTFEELGYLKFKPARDGDFEIEDFEIEMNSSEYYKDFSGSGTITTDLKGIYRVLVQYERDGGDPDDGFSEGYFVCDVVDGEGGIETFDYFDAAASFDDPEYEFEIIGYIKFNVNGKNQFEVSDFDMDEEQYDYWTEYHGEGQIETSMKGSYLLLLEIDKSGGDHYTRDGYYAVLVTDGEGVITTDDTRYEDDFDFEEPEYEVEILGYAKFKN